MNIYKCTRGAKIIKNQYWGSHDDDWKECISHQTMQGFGNSMKSDKNVTVITNVLSQNIYKCTRKTKNKIRKYIVTNALNGGSGGPPPENFQK